MNKILCLSLITGTMFIQNISTATASEQEISNRDFTRLVCSQLKKTDNKPEALNEIKAMTKSNISTSQLSVLEEVAKSDSYAQDFCDNFALPRL